MSFKILYINELTGEFGRLPDLATINAGGVIGPTFYVGNRPLLFADGTATDGSNASILSVTLQGVYNVSTPAVIDLGAGKNFTINALNSKYFRIDAATGKVTITGDLEVQGNSTVIEGVLANIDQIIVNPPGPSVIGFTLEPMTGVTMTADLLQIKPTNGGAPAVRVDSSGNLILTGLFNGVSATNLANHINAGSSKHAASQISVTGPFTNVAGTDVEQALSSIDNQLSSVIGAIKTHEHIQTLASDAWTIAHAKNSTRPVVMIYDDTNHQVLPDDVHIVDNNNVQVLFNTPLVGRALLILF